MSKPQQITDEILINYMLGETDVHTTALVDLWLREAEVNQQYYNHFKEIWEAGMLLPPDAVPDVDKSWNTLAKKLQSKAPIFSIRTIRYLGAVAASILLVFGLYMFWSSDSTTKPLAITKQAKDSTQTVRQIVSENVYIIDTLPDKSIVTLNRKASLELPKEFASHERRVQLNGEAFFSIQPNKKKPFIIETPNDVEITVLGTSFNVKAYADFTEVVVETGIVQLKKFDKIIILHANEMVRIDNMDSTMQIKKSKDRLYKYYRSREFECENTPLWKVVEVLNEAYDDSIIIDNNALKKIQLTTRFSDESLESILNIIGETFEITVEKKGNKYILK